MDPRRRYEVFGQLCHCSLSEDFCDCFLLFVLSYQNSNLIFWVLEGIKGIFVCTHSCVLVRVNSQCVYIFFLSFEVLRVLLAQHCNE